MSKKEISPNQIDGLVVRFIALQVLILVTLLYLFSLKWLAIFLIVDFALRAFTTLPAPLAISARFIVRTLNLQPKPIFAAPKKFAALVGFIFSSTIGVLLWYNLLNAALAVGVVLGFFAFLEGVFNICAGCYVYDWLVAPVINKRNASD